MELTNEFRVGVPPAQAWTVLTDVERIAPCMPGAQLQEVEGEEYRGVVKVKVGPITAQYKGKATFVERAESEGRVVLRAEGRDTRGQGNANATITAQLQPDGEGTKVTVTTDLNVTGKVAQFGRGVLADVSSKLLGQFVDCLETNVLGDSSAMAPPPAVENAHELAVEGGPSAPPAAPSAPPAPSPAGEQVVEAAAAPPAPAPEAATATIAPNAGHNGKSEEPTPGGASAQPPAPAATIRRIQHAEAEPVDLLDAAGGSIAKRVAPLAIIGLIILLLLRRRRRA